MVVVVVDGPGDRPGFDVLTEGDQNEGEIVTGKLAQEANRKQRRNLEVSKLWIYHKKFGEELSKKVTRCRPQYNGRHCLSS